MRIRKKSRRLRSTPIIYLSAIISLSLMGVGYGFWTDGLNVDVNITTGNANGTLQYEGAGYGDLDIGISDDGKRLSFTGEVYPDFKENIKIKVLDTGTVPLVLEKIQNVETSDIEELSLERKTRFGLFSYFKDDVIETFNLKISPPEEETMDIIMERSTFSMQGVNEDEDKIQSKINKLEREIEDLEAEIDRLNVTEKYNFRYILNFIQGI